MSQDMLNRRTILATAGGAGLAALVPGEVSAQAVALEQTLPFPPEQAGRLHRLNVRASHDTFHEIATAEAVPEKILAQIRDALGALLRHPKNEFFTEKEARQIDELAQTLVGAVDRTLDVTERLVNALHERLREQHANHVVIAVLSIVEDGLAHTHELIKGNEPTVRHVISIVLCDMLGALRGVDRAIQFAVGEEPGILGRWRWAFVLIGAVAGSGSASAFSVYRTRA